MSERWRGRGNIKTISKDQILRPGVKPFIWEKILASEAAPYSDAEALLKNSVQYVGLMLPRTLDTTWYILERPRVNESIKSAVIMEYRERVEGQEVGTERKIRYLPVGDPELYLPFLKAKANKFNIKALKGKEFRMILPTPPFREDDIPHILGSGWNLQEEALDGINPRTMTHFGMVYNHVPAFSLSGGYVFVDLTPDLHEQVENLLAFYPLNLFRSNVLYDGSHMGVMTRTGELVAMAGITASANPVHILGDLVTHGDFRRRGLGEALLSRLIRMKITKGSILTIDTINIESENTCKKIGMKEYGKTLWSVHEKKGII